MNCPQCPRALVQPEGGVAWCEGCGWGKRDWFIKLYNETVGRIGELQAEVLVGLQKIHGLEAANAVLDRQRIGLATELQRKGAAETMVRQIERDAVKDSGNLQLFCAVCGKGAGDDKDFHEGILKKCPYCESTGPFVHSIELQTELLDRDELITAQRTRIGAHIAEKVELTTENRRLTAIYHAAENLTMPIGRDGEATFNTASALVVELMDAMHTFDEGSRKPTMTAEDIQGAPV